MKTPSKALDLIRKWEGFREAWYDDGWGHRTIGYGFTPQTRGLDPEHLSEPMSRGHADLLLIGCVARHYEPGVMEAVETPLAAARLPAGCVGALVSLAWNVGVRAVQESDLMEAINAGQMGAAAAEFQRWAYVDGEKVDGLVRRRQEEATLFTAGTLLGETPDVVPVAGVEAV